MAGELTKINVRSLVSIGPNFRLGRAPIRSLVVMNTAPQSLSMNPARVLLKLTPHNPNGDRTRLGKITARTLARLSPNFRWIDVFSDIIFPNDISQNSDAATKFNTVVNEVASGHDQRISRWDYPIMEYNVAYGVRTMEDLHDLIRFFRVVKGKRNSFRFLDKIDHTSSFAYEDESREAEPITFQDQLLGVGDDDTAAFQLVKHYDFDFETATRPIYKPITGTVIVGVAGTQITNFSVDYSTGIVTITPRVSKTLPLATLALVDEGLKRYRITVADVPAEHLPLFNVGEWLDCYGFSLDIDKAVVITSTTTEVVFTWPAAPGTPIVSEGPTASVDIQSNNTPREGQEVTAGFQFHVPVRFDTDRIPVRLEYYGVGSATEIKLVEVRPDEE